MLALASCKKDKQELSDYQANLTIVNGIADKDGLVWKFSEKEFTLDQFRSYYFNNGYFDSEQTVGVPINKTVPITIADYNDTTQIVYKAKKEFKSGDLYTLYLSGQGLAIDTLMVKESDIPYHSYRDSMMSVRFVNIASELESINVNLAGKPLGSEVTNLKYQGITTFKTYPAKIKDTRYSFEFHDSVTGELLGVYQFDPNNFNYRVPRFKTLSLIFKGLKDWGFRVVRVDY